MATAIYPGSFDPITNGHVDVLRRASLLFENVIIAVLNNSAKKSFLSIDDKINLISKSVADIKNVQVDYFDGLAVNYAKSKNASAIIRGLRAVSDFEYEMQMAQMNKHLDTQLETIFLVPKVEYNFLSSSLVREVAMLGGDVSEMVPRPVYEYLMSIKRGI